MLRHRPSQCLREKASARALNVSRSYSIIFGLLVAALTCVLQAMASPPPAASRIRSVEIRGTAFRVTLATGKTLEGRELAGATISLALFGEPRPRRVWLARIIHDPMDRQGDVLLYDMRVLDPATGTSAPLCEDAVDGGHWAFPLRGQWDRDGRRISDKGFTLTCAADAQGKCVRFGYKPNHSRRGRPRTLPPSLHPYGPRRLLRERGDHPRRNAD